MYTWKLLGYTDLIILMSILHLMKIQTIPKKRMIKSLNKHSFQSQLHITLLRILPHHKLLLLIIITKLIIKTTESILSQ